MINIVETNGSIYRIQNKGNMVTARMSTGKKQKDGTWENMWWNVKFVGENKHKITVHGDKTRIKITSGILEQNVVGDKTYTNVVIFDFDVIGKIQGVVPPKEEYNDDSELPF